MITRKILDGFLQKNGSVHEKLERVNEYASNTHYIILLKDNY